jgi:hypothetical protein
MKDEEIKDKSETNDKGNNNSDHGNGNDHGNDDDHGNGKDKVEITINDVKHSVHRGRITVVKLKELGGVNPAWVLYLFGQTEPLDDAGSLTIKGGEAFLASARSGQSS